MCRKKLSKEYRVVWLSGEVGVDPGVEFMAVYTDNKHAAQRLAGQIDGSIEQREEVVGFWEGRDGCCWEGSR